MPLLISDNPLRSDKRYWTWTVRQLPYWLAIELEIHSHQREISSFSPLPNAIHCTIHCRINCTIHFIIHCTINCTIHCTINQLWILGKLSKWWKGLPLCSASFLPRDLYLFKRKTYIFATDISLKQVEFFSRFLFKRKIYIFAIDILKQVVTVHKPSIGLLRRGLQLGVVSMQLNLVTK